MNYNHPKLKKALINDYVIGAMSTQARRRFERLLMTDPELRTLLNQSEQKWNRLAERIPPMAVPTDLWKRIEQRIFGATPQTVTQTMKASNDSVWKGWAVAASLAAVFLTGYIVMQTQKPIGQAGYMAVVLNQTQQPSWHVSIDPDNNTLAITALAEQTLPDDKAFELWLIADNQPQPVSMGLIPPKGRVVLPLDKTLAQGLHQVPAKLAVTVEPAGGSPTGQPTSAPIYIGNMVEFSS